MNYQGKDDTILGSEYSSFSPSNDANILKWNKLHP